MSEHPPDHNRERAPREPEDSGAGGIPLPKPPAWMTHITPPPEPGAEEAPPALTADRPKMGEMPKPPAWRTTAPDTPLDPPRPPAWMTPIADAEAETTPPPPPPERQAPPQRAYPPSSPDAAGAAGAPRASSTSAAQLGTAAHSTPRTTMSTPVSPSRSTKEITPQHLVPEVEIEEATAAQAEDDTFFEEVDEIEDEGDEAALKIDPAFAIIVLLAVTVLGMGGLAPDIRYTLTSTVLALLGVTAILVDHVPVRRPTFREVLVGAVYGLLVGLPLALIAGPQLRQLSERMFGSLGEAAVFQATAFTLPMAETLFFRGALQAARGLIPAALASGTWSVALFLPGPVLLQYPLVALVIGLYFFFISFLYGAVQERLGLVSAWACQVAVSVLVLWASRLLA